jgi:hypothetical protein
MQANRSRSSDRSGRTMMTECPPLSPSKGSQRCQRRSARCLEFRRRLTCRWSKLEPLRPEDALIKVVAAKISDPTTNKLGEPNKKVLAFTAFADTAPVTSMDRCWSGPQKSAASTWCSFAAAATSAPRSAKTPLTISSRTFLRGRTKHRSKIPTMPQTAEIDILIATDCISEG